MEWKQGKYLVTKIEKMDKIVYMPKYLDELFCFLEKQYGFVMIDKNIDNSGLLYLYQNKCMKVAIGLDYRDGFFHIDLIYGSNTQYPNDAEYGRKIQTLSQSVIKFDDNYDVSKLNVVNKEDVYKVAQESAKVLRKYGDRMLSC